LVEATGAALELVTVDWDDEVPVEVLVVPDVVEDAALVVVAAACSATV
jgi:hypothetical protein